MNIDGISGNTRSGDHLDTPINMDAVGEVKVLTGTYQAEYGKGSGSIINIVARVARASSMAARITTAATKRLTPTVFS
ncbi:MAG: hypothetical protein ACR2NN_07280 [Bryobacteraceae bacterium]